MSQYQAVEVKLELQNVFFFDQVFERQGRGVARGRARAEGQWLPIPEHVEGWEHRTNNWLPDE